MKSHKNVEARKLILIDLKPLSTRQPSKLFSPNYFNENYDSNP